MKPTNKNLNAKRIIERYAATLAPGRRLELTTSGKVHTGMGILAAFTNAEAAREVLKDLGFFPSGGGAGSFTEYVKGERARCPGCGSVEMMIPDGLCQDCFRTQKAPEPQPDHIKYAENPPI